MGLRVKTQRFDVRRRDDDGCSVLVGGVPYRRRGCLECGRHAERSWIILGIHASAHVRLLYWMHAEGRHHLEQHVMAHDRQ